MLPWFQPTEDQWLGLAAWQLKLPSDAVFACSTAAWMHGLGATPTDPLEVILPPSTSIRSHTGVIVRRSRLAPTERTEIKGLPATTLPRTLRDVCLFGATVDALTAIDAALHKKPISKLKLLEDPVARSGRRGSARFRRLLELAAPAESPMETRLRWLLISRRLPMPEVQVDLHDAERRFVGRADLYYPDARLVIEFDGGNHRERLVSDDRRQNLLINAGYRVLRFTASDVYQRPDLTAGQVRGALATPW
jgi:very-short-patch-repair endonuclease